MIDASSVTPLSAELQRALHWMKAHPQDVAVCSMRECARRAGMSPATFTRLSHALGYAGYDDHKLEYQEQLAGFSSRARALLQRGGDWLDALTRAQHANSESVQTLNSLERFEAVADMMLRARRVCFLGLRGSHGLAFHLHYSYALLASNGTLLTDAGGTLVDQLHGVRRGDLLMALSQAPYTRQTIDSVLQLAQEGVDVVAITDSEHSPMTRAARHTLLFRTESPSYFHSMVGAVAVSEAVTAAVMLRGGKRVLDHLQSIQRRLDDQQAYVEYQST